MPSPPAGKYWLLKAWGADVKKLPEPDLWDDGTWYKWYEDSWSRYEARQELSDLGWIVFAEHDPVDESGNETDTHKRTIAKMVFVLPDGTRRPYEYDFGYGYPAHSAAYMFEDGNYSCDCNRSNFIGEDFECGHTIKMLDFEVEER